MKRSQLKQLIREVLSAIGDEPLKWKYTTARKYMGDDQASWAIFNKKTGRPIVTGLYKSEVNGYRKRIEQELSSGNVNEKLVAKPPPSGHDWAARILTQEADELGYEDGREPYRYGCSDWNSREEILAYLNDYQGEWVNVDDIASAQGIPYKETLNIIRQLKRQDILVSKANGKVRLKSATGKAWDIDSPSGH